MMLHRVSRIPAAQVGDNAEWYGASSNARMCAKLSCFYAISDAAIAGCFVVSIGCVDVAPWEHNSVHSSVQLR